VEGLPDDLKVGLDREIKDKGAVAARSLEANPVLCEKWIDRNRRDIERFPWVCMAW
jgi:hypothetical protein